MKFTKMQGAGNDYIYFDCLETPFPADPSEAAIRLSDRRFGIGGDGIILILPSSAADFRMRIFNADGSEARMCGNGSRCVGRFVKDRGYTDRDSVTLETESGIKTINYGHNTDGSLSVSVDMGKAEFEPEKVPARLDCAADSFYVNGERALCVSTGNPHCVIFTEDIKNYPLEQTAHKLTGAGYFPEGVNTEIVRLMPDGLDARVYERGSGETLACGTGACASAAAAVKLGYFACESRIRVGMPGGDLYVSVHRDFSLSMEGPAEFVFEGSVEL